MREPKSDAAKVRMSRALREVLALVPPPSHANGAASTWRLATLDVVDLLKLY
jgi:hypothetical protein